MPQERLPKQALLARVSAKRPLGRPRKRWVNYIEDLSWNRLGLLSNKEQDVVQVLKMILINLNHQMVMINMKVKVLLMVVLVEKNIIIIIIMKMDVMVDLVVVVDHIKKVVVVVDILVD